jgi:hypothetical protein
MSGAIPLFHLPACMAWTGTSMRLQKYFRLDSVRVSAGKDQIIGRCLAAETCCKSRAGRC